MLSRLPPKILIPIMLLLLMFLLSYAIPFVRGGKESQHEVRFERKLIKPEWAYPFGTDSLGRDLFSITFQAGRASFQVGLAVVILAVLIGVPIGILAGYRGGITDEISMRITDGFLAFPPLILPFVIASALGPSLNHITLAIAIAWFPWYVRIARSQVLEIKTSGYVLSAKLMGANWLHIMRKHLLPNIYPAILVQASIDVGYAILTAAGLSFLGLGAQPPQLEWGLLITQSRVSFLYSWWTAIFPGGALFISVLLFNLLGDSLREYYDPKLAEALRR